METKRKKIKWKRDLVGWLVMLPALILFCFYVWGPLVYSIKLSLYSAKGAKLIDFVGLDNYRSVINDVNFASAFGNTFKYIACSLLFGFVIPIIFAILISETVHMKSFFRVSVYFPNIIPGIAVAIIWGFLYKPGKTGVLNIILSHMGLEPLQWLNNSGWTILLIIVMLTWRSAGSTSLIYMAGISGIDPSLYEAATIDGAGIMQRVRNITIPSVFSLGKTMLILQVISVFQILYEPLVMTNGGPNGASISAMQLVYMYAFEQFKYPKAAALSVLICIILVILSGLYMFLTREKKEKLKGGN